jgi:hypothetical protein
MLIWISCNDDSPAPNSAPVLRFERFERQLGSDGKDSILDFYLYLEDEDGNVGLTDADTAAPFTYGSPWFYNLWIIQRDWSNGSPVVLTIPGTTDTLESGMRLPDLRSDFREKYISAEFKISLKAEPYPGLRPQKMQYAFQLFDRNLNTSSRVYSPKIELNL